MNKIRNKVLLAADKFISEMHLRQPRFTYKAFGSFTKNKEWIQKFQETGDSWYIYRHDMAYGGFKDLPRRTASIKYYLINIANIINI